MSANTVGPTVEQLTAFGRAWNSDLTYRQTDKIVEHVNALRQLGGKEPVKGLLPGYTRWGGIPSQELRVELYTSAVALGFFRSAV